MKERIIYWRLTVLIVGLGFLVEQPTVFAQVFIDMSCNGLQLTQQQQRLDRVASELPPAQRAQFEGMIKDFRASFEILRQEAVHIETAYSEVFFKYIQAVAQSHLDLAEKYDKEVLQETPGLATGLRNNDREAQANYWVAISAKFEKDSVLRRDLHGRLEQDREVGRLSVASLELQNKLHRQEYELAVARQAMPLPAVERQHVDRRASDSYLGTVTLTLEQKGTLKAAMEKNEALRALIVTDAVGKRAMRGSLSSQGLDGASADAQLSFDTEVNAIVVVAVNETRDVYRRTEAARLRANLDEIHIGDHYMPPVEARGTLMRDKERPLTVEVAKTMGHALQSHNQVKDTYRRIHKPPPPPVLSPGEGSSNRLIEWGQRTAAQLRNDIKRITTIYKLD